MKTDEEQTPGLRAAILAGCMVAFLGFGFAATFGVFLTPMSQDLGWGREVFSLSVAVQLLTWGFAQPIAGVITTDRRKKVVNHFERVFPDDIVRFRRQRGSVPLAIVGPKMVEFQSKSGLAVAPANT